MTLNTSSEFNSLIDNLSDMVYVTTFKGDFLFFNNSVEELFGYTPDEVLGRNFLEFIHPDDLHEVREFYLRNLRELIKETFHEFRVVKKDGTVIWVSQNTRAIFNEDKTRIEEFTGILRNVDAHKENELRLKKSEENLRLIAETLTDSYYLYNVIESKYEYMSPNSIDVMGASPEFFYAGKKHTDQFVHPEDRPLLYNANKLVNAGVSYDIEFRIILGDKIQWVSEKSTPIKDEFGKVVKNSGVCRIITAQKKAQELIAQQNKEIEQSITYAELIQKSVLPTKEEFKDILPNSFVFYSPKETLSGDFYMVNKIQSNQKEEMIAVVVADCTGHGIPGGILSLLCSALLKETFTNPNINSPQEALGYVRTKLISLFRADKTRALYDGMDIGFCVYNPNDRELYFSGAHISLVIMRNGELIEYKGDRRHVGYSEELIDFTGVTAPLEKNDIIYLFTDGFADQFGGNEYRKYMKKKFYDLIIELNTYPIEKQKDLFIDEFNEWLGDGDQTDDVTVMGFAFD